MIVLAVWESMLRILKRIQRKDFKERKGKVTLLGENLDKPEVSISEGLYRGSIGEGRYW